MKRILVHIILMFVWSNTFAQFKVYQNGSVSIGSTTPPLWQTRVQIIGSTLFTANTSTPTSSALIRGLNSFSTATNPDYTWYNNDQVGMFHPASNIIGFSTNGNERLRIDPNGNIGIGLTNPQSKLDVFSSFRVSTWTSCIVDGSGTSGSIVLYPTQTWYLHIGKSTNRIGELRAYHVLTDQLTYTSDERIKENIQLIENPIEKIKKINAVQYNLNDNYLGSLPGKIKTQYKKTQIGFLAQNILQVFPELVEIVDSTTGMYGIKYNEMIPVLLEAIKIQQSQIEKFNEYISYCCSQNFNFTSNKQNITTTDDLPTSKLYQNNPNPFNLSTTINYFVVSKNSNAQSQLLIFDLHGLLKKAYTINSIGKGSIEILASELPAGMYLYTLVVENVEVETRKMILTK